MAVSYDWTRIALGLGCDLCCMFVDLGMDLRNKFGWIDKFDVVIGYYLLFSMLILDVVNCCHLNTVAVVPAKNVEVVATKYDANRAKNVPLPVRRDAKTGNMVATVNVVPATESNNPAIRPQGDGNIYGDVVIETRGEARVLKNGARIRGNLYLQRMRKYVLPCNIVIDGSLFLRDVNILQFCGPFTVTGNIYVSPRSSFGPIPYNARIGGQVIL